MSKGGKLASFLCLYRGETIGAARMVAVSSDPTIVRQFAERLLDDPGEPQRDDVLREIDKGRRQALRLVRDETQE